MHRIAADMGPAVMGLDAVTSCLGWPGKVNNPQHVLRVRHSPKLVLTNALHDPATGYAWAVNAARQLGNRAVLVTYEGWGHGVYRRSPCTTTQFDTYLTDLVVPAKGSRCPAVEPPTAPPARKVGGPTGEAGSPEAGSTAATAPRVRASQPGAAWRR